MEQKRITIEGEYMENIRSIAGRMLELAKEGYIVDTVFNGTPLSTENMSTVEDILQQREDYQQKEYEAYKNSPQYAIDKENARQKELEEKAMTERLLQEFNSLDFSTVSEVVNWIGRMSQCRNDIVANITQVLPMLQASGYISLKELAKANAVHGFDMTAETYVKSTEDLDTVGNYLISRAIQDIQEFGTISGVMSHFTQIYEQRLNEQDKLIALKQ